jgi:histidinol-phosphate/aromatic aminotransferase/cobyric acid decarboxylase-like protein
VKRERELLAEYLEGQGFDPIPSQGNFVYFEAPNPQPIVSRLADAGIAVRVFPDRPGLESSIRITVPGNPDEYDRVAGALASALDKTAMELNK